MVLKVHFTNTQTCSMGGCVCVYFRKYLCQQKPVAPTPTEKKFNLAEGKLIKKFRPIFTKIFYLIHPTRQLLFFLFVNTLGEKISLLPGTAVKLCYFEEFGIFSSQHIWYGWMLFNRLIFYFFSGCCYISSDPAPKPV